MRVTCGREHHIHIRIINFSIAHFSIINPAIITKTINGIGNDANLTELTLSTEAAGLVAQYKDIIREQDFKLQTVRNELQLKHADAEAARKQLIDTQQSNTQLFDQNILLKAQLAAVTNAEKKLTSSSSHHSHNESHPISQSTQISFYEAENARLVKELAEVNKKLGESLLVGSAISGDAELLELLSDQVRRHT